MKADSAYRVLVRQTRLRLVVELMAGDGMHVPAGLCQMEGQVGNNLAGGGMVGRKISIEEENSLHRGNADHILNIRVSSSYQKYPRKRTAATVGFTFIMNLAK